MCAREAHREQVDCYACSCLLRPDRSHPTYASGGCLVALVVGSSGRGLTYRLRIASDACLAAAAVVPGNKRCSVVRELSSTPPHHLTLLLLFCCNLVVLRAGNRGSRLSYEHRWPAARAHGGCGHSHDHQSTHKVVGGAVRRRRRRRRRRAIVTSIRRSRVYDRPH